jgi:hypothetical protein
MFVGTPRYGFGNMFCRSTRPRGDAVCDRDVNPGGLYSNKCHSSSSTSSGQLRLKIGSKSAPERAVRALEIASPLAFRFSQPEPYW